MDFPDPVSPQIIVTRLFKIVSMMSSSRIKIGSFFRCSETIFERLNLEFMYSVSEGLF